jgi:hypothetical protein
VKFIVHDRPALRAESNYIARVDLAPFGFDGLVEQVWLRQLSDLEFSMGCIPFRAYGLALEDVVGLSPDGISITELIRPSGRRAIRALLVPDLAPGDKDGISERLDAVAGDLELLREWSGDRHIAIDVPPGSNIQPLLDLLISEQDAGHLRWEWADVTSFAREAPR